MEWPCYTVPVLNRHLVAAPGRATQYLGTPSNRHVVCRRGGELDAAAPPAGACGPARPWPSGESSVILLQPPLPSVGGSIGNEERWCSKMIELSPTRARHAMPVAVGESSVTLRRSIPPLVPTSLTPTITICRISSTRGLSPEPRPPPQLNLGITNGNVSFCCSPLSPQQGVSTGVKRGGGPAN